MNKQDLQSLGHFEELFRRQSVRLREMAEESARLCGSIPSASFDKPNEPPMVRHHAFGLQPPKELGWYWLKNTSGGSCVALRLKTQMHDDEWMYGFFNDDTVVTDRDLVALGYQFGPRVYEPNGIPEQRQ